MEFTTLAFLVFATVAVVSAGAVITVRNPVHAALCLVLTFFTVACTWILAGAEFLGVALILVYVGAVMVLFLFVVMMLDVDTEPMREGFVRYLPLGLLVAVIMLIEMLTLIGVKAEFAAAFGEDPAAAQGLSNTEWIARAVHRFPAAVRGGRGHPDHRRDRGGDADPASSTRRQAPESRGAVARPCAGPGPPGQDGCGTSGASRRYRRSR